MEKFNWKNFTIKDVENKYISHTDAQISFDYQSPTKNAELTISDYLDVNIYKWSENIYLEIIVYAGYNERKLKIYSKDNHELIKNIAKEIISQS